MPILDIILPVHNEAASIASTVEEIYSVLSPLVDLRIIISEDGSTDGTPERLQELAQRFPLLLLIDQNRLGYSRAVIRALAAADSTYVLCLDGDGQCDPGDFPAHWQSRDSADIIIGWRVNRRDSTIRLLASRSFGFIFRRFFPTLLHDPSCPFILMKSAIANQLARELGTMNQGLWWEFVARATSRGLTFKELPIKHRERAAGETQIYSLKKLPGVGSSHLGALLKLYREIRRRPK